jgi:hypothetical protein
VPEAKLIASSAVLNAANGSPTSVKGETCLVFCVQHKQLFVDLRDDARWQSSDSVLNLGEPSVKPRCKPSRRIYARESICVPSGMMVNVPVDSAYANLYVPYTDWITGAKEFKDGLLAARTLQCYRPQVNATALILGRLLQLLSCPNFVVIWLMSTVLMARANDLPRANDGL